MSKLQEAPEQTPDEAFHPESVSVTLGIKVKIGNGYNMATINYTLTGKIGSNATVDEAKDAAEAIVDGWVSEKLKKVQEKNSR